MEKGPVRKNISSALGSVAELSMAGLDFDQ